MIDGELYTIPMAIEESSVVAAAAKSAGFWMDRGGFTTEVLSTEKIGHVHFMYEGDATPLFEDFDALEKELRAATAELVANMEARGGGISQNCFGRCHRQIRRLLRARSNLRNLRFHGRELH